MAGLDPWLSGSAIVVVESKLMHLQVAVAGLDPAIHAFLGWGLTVSKTWVPGSSPGKACLRLYRMLPSPLPYFGQCEPHGPGSTPPPTSSRIIPVEPRDTPSQRGSALGSRAEQERG